MHGDWGGIARSVSRGRRRRLVEAVGLAPLGRGHRATRKTEKLWPGGLSCVERRKVPCPATWADDSTGRRGQGCGSPSGPGAARHQLWEGVWRIEGWSLSITLSAFPSGHHTSRDLLCFPAVAGRSPGEQIDSEPASQADSGRLPLGSRGEPPQLVGSAGRNPIATTDT